MVMKFIGLFSFLVSSRIICNRDLINPGAHNLAASEGASCLHHPTQLLFPCLSELASAFLSFLSCFRIRRVRHLPHPSPRPVSSERGCPHSCLHHQPRR